MNNTKERDLNLDLIRCVAFIAVLVMHYYDNSGFYLITMDSAGDFIMAMVRMLFTICVPLFLMLSGYLCHRKTLSARYYLGILRVLELYILCSLACIVFEWLYLDRQFGLREIVSTVLNFEVCGYAWYVMLYFGLFLMIPFLNLAYNGLESRGQKLTLVATFFTLSILPSLLNAYFHIYSVWWSKLYPLCYYFTGAFLSEYMPKKRPVKMGLLLLAALVVFCLYDHFKFHAEAGCYDGIHYDHYQVYILAVLSFLFLASLDLSSWPGFWKKQIGIIAELSFAAYLCSWISDGIIYRVFVPCFPQPKDRFVWILMLVPLSALTSLLMAQVVHWIYRPIDRLIRPRLEAVLKH